MQYMQVAVDGDTHEMQTTCSTHGHEQSPHAATGVDQPAMGAGRELACANSKCCPKVCMKMFMYSLAAGAVRDDHGYLLRKLGRCCSCLNQSLRVQYN